VIQEALANVAKHAGATEAKLVVRYGPDQLFLSVQDNGKGFDPAETEATPVGHSRNGIRNQRSRVAELGGTIELRSRFGGGTRLDVTVPLEALSRDERAEA
jgi:signal transduction histidine kinase